MSNESKKEELQQQGLLEMVKSLQQQVRELQGGGPMLVDPDAPKFHTVHVKLYEGKPVSNVYNAKEVGIDPVTQNRLMECDIDVVDSLDEKGGAKLKTCKKVNWSGLVNGEGFERLDKLTFEKIEKPVEVVLGTVEKVEYGEWSQMATGIRVPMKVKGIETIFLVQMPEASDDLDPQFLGKKVPLKWVNI